VDWPVPPCKSAKKPGLSASTRLIRTWWPTSRPMDWSIPGSAEHRSASFFSVSCSGSSSFRIRALYSIGIVEIGPMFAVVMLGAG
jgi:hypothetical protein